MLKETRKETWNGSGNVKLNVECRAAVASPALASKARRLLSPAGGLLCMLLYINDISNFHCTVFVSLAHGFAGPRDCRGDSMR